jgi:hypothetical protein
MALLKKGTLLTIQKITGEDPVNVYLVQDDFLSYILVTDTFEVYKFYDIDIQYHGLSSSSYNGITRADVKEHLSRFKFKLIRVN